MAYKLLDLFCCQGGASMGYHRAGFEVTGVDWEPQPKYPFPFIQADCTSLSLDFLRQFDVIAASPPCKTHTVMKAFSDPSHKDFLPQTRDLLRASGLPYIIENVEGAPMVDPVVLCGSSFGLHIRRHRQFESNVRLHAPPCRHEEQDANSPGFRAKRYHAGYPEEYTAKVVSVYGRGNGYGAGESQLWRDVMGMPWASKDGLREAIPPVYTEFLGRQLVEYLDALA